MYNNLLFRVLPVLYIQHVCVGNFLLSRVRCSTHLCVHYVRLDVPTYCDLRTQHDHHGLVFALYLWHA